MASLTEISQMLQDFSEDRPSLKENNTPKVLMKLLAGEVAEASESLDDPENLASELSDVIIFALTIANQYGFDMDEEIRTKIAYNHARYNAVDFQGDYEQARLKGKSREKEVQPLFYGD